MRYAILAAGAIAIVLVVSFMVFAHYVMEGHPVPTTSLDQVAEGMKPHQVERLYGKPTRITESADGSEDWLYSSPYRWCMVSVEFTPTGKVAHVIHDH